MLDYASCVTVSDIFYQVRETKFYLILYLCCLFLDSDSSSEYDQIPDSDEGMAYTLFDIQKPFCRRFVKSKTDLHILVTAINRKKIKNPNHCCVTCATSSVTLLVYEL